MAAFKVNITKNGNAIKFQFTDSDHYLYGNGEIEVPVNSLSLVIDESDFVTFKKASTNDTFITFNPANSNLSDKAGVINFYKTNMVGSTGGGSGSGVTPSEVQTMIDNSLEDYYTDDEVDAALSGKASVSDVSALSGQVATKVAISDFNAYSAATDARLAEDEEVTAAALNNLDENKQDALEYYSEDTTVNTATIHIENTDDGTVGEVYVDGASVDISALRTEEDEDNGSMVETHSDINGNNAGIAMSYEKLVDDEEAAHSYLNVEEGLISMEVMADEDSTTLDVYSNGVTINGENVLTDGMISTAITSGSTDSEIPTAKATYDAIQAGGGGGATYSAGTNISIDTANTINCTLPITIKTGTGDRKNLSIFTTGNTFDSSRSQGLIVGQSNTSNGDNVFVIGKNNSASANFAFSQGQRNNSTKSYSATFGYYVNSNNVYELSCGSYNNSVTGSTASGQTLFSVGNGTSSARHNAFEIRQNGDIYVNDGTNDVRLQDTILALGGLKFVQCTQAYYDSLVSGGTVDSSTIYFITNVVS